MNPYEVLQIPAGATLDEVEDAYDALFDEYEAPAQAGDAAAIKFLNAINQARDTLVDAEKRAQLDASLVEEKATTPAASATQSMALRPREKTPRDERAGHAPPARNKQQRTTQNRAQARSSSAATLTRRAGSYAVREVARPRRTWVSYLPYIVLIAVLGFGIAVGTSYLQNKGSCVPADLPTGATVATVDNVPIYQRDWDVRESTDKRNVLSDPLFASFFDSSTITGTRALDALKFDSLDKLINMEVIQQQAKKEGLYPTEDQQKTLVDQAYASDRKGAESFNDMLCRLQVSEATYRRTIVENIVYTVVANQHIPATGTSESKTDAFINWMCSTRQNYNVQIMATFLVPNNPSCTSGLPSDLRLPGLDQTPVPDGLPTAVAPVGTSPTSTAPAPGPTDSPNK
ncbi:MAG: SurA N-terminal domain-containing protein [Chloroflexota bacterium]